MGKQRKYIKYSYNNFHQYFFLIFMSDKFFDIKLLNKLIFDIYSYIFNQIYMKNSNNLSYNQ